MIDEAIKRIERDYYRPISEAQLSNASVAGMVASLHDRFSHYLTPSELKEFDLPPHFAGIGVEVGPHAPRACRSRACSTPRPRRAPGLQSGQT